MYVMGTGHNGQESIKLGLEIGGGFRFQNRWAVGLGWAVEVAESQSRTFETGVSGSEGGPPQVNPSISVPGLLPHPDIHENRRSARPQHHSAWCRSDRLEA